MKLKNYEIIGLGEILWDVLPSGKMLGGAPANFAFHSRALGNRGWVVSAVGKDGLGEQIIQKLTKLGVPTDFIQQHDSHPTGTVDVQLDKNGNPEYIIHEQVAWDFIEFDHDVQMLAGRCDAVCFGSLAQRSPVSEQSIQEFLKHTHKECLRVFDMNLRQQYYSKELLSFNLKSCNVLKMNAEELQIVCRLFGFEHDRDTALRRIMEAYDLLIIALTLGDQGSILLSSDKISFQTVEKIKVADTVGAGDAFTAGLVYGLLRNFSLKETHILAGRLSAFVCTQQGATPDIQEFLQMNANLFGV